MTSWGQVPGIKPEGAQEKAARLAAVKAQRDAARAEVRQLGLCEYYALCANLAVGTTEHPILGAVPTCQRCADRFDLELVAE